MSWFGTSNELSARADYYFACWALVLPVSSILIFPFMQGTTAAYLFALALLFPPLAALILGLEGMMRYYRTLGVLVVVFVLLNALAQMALAASGLNALGAPELVDPFDRNLLLRRTLFTQSLYLLAAASTFIFVRFCYNERWDRYFFFGAILLATYGIYELVFFAATGISGDFLTNRHFGGFTGSWFQTIHLGPFTMQRLKSLTGEPSMYAFTILPFWVYALHTGRTKTQLILLASLLLTTSTTALMGMACYVVLRMIYYGPLDRMVIAGAIVLLILAIMGAMGNTMVLEAYDKLVADKLGLRSSSAVTRFDSAKINWHYYMTLPLLNQIFGMGFGYVRATNMLVTLMVNLGLVGTLITTAIFFLPVTRLGSSERERGLKAALVVVYVTMMISVPEFSYLSSWLFLGMGYNALDKMRRSEQSSMLQQTSRMERPVLGM